VWCLFLKAGKIHLKKVGEVMEEYKGEGLRALAWIIAGGEIIKAVKEVGGVGGLFGGGCGPAGGANAALLAENAQLKAERYSDNAAKEQAERLLVNYLKPYGDEIANARVREASLRSEFDGYKANMELRIQLAEQKAQCCCDKTNMRVDCIEGKVNAITATKIPKDAVLAA
jgi:hypothetical protein